MSSSLYNFLIKMLLEYGFVVLFSYTSCDILRLDNVQNRFMHFASYRLKIPHPPHDYGYISVILKIISLIKRHNISFYCFINELIEGTIDVPRL